ncbi:MAG: helix-hairpin-helix domain-containing protein, partial [Paludibacteraceae bacterium]|nr:helix-hairpin-helix domain-containing protein [Paludibacteraceae bacterium]
FARRIVAYRDKLGGYYAKEQLMEVYGFTAELYEKVKNQIKVNPALIKKIDVNAYDIGYLKRHPYISYYEAKAIVDYRNSKKTHHIDSIEELRNLPDLKQNFEIIRLYIMVVEK